jgi:hypothetical protein
MGLETTFDFPDDLVVTNPLSTDSRREGDDHIRGIKNVLVNFSKDLNGAIASSSHMDQIYPIGVVLVTLEGPTGPGDVIGGTWEKQGTVALDTVVPGSESSTIVGDQLAFHWRTA